MVEHERLELGRAVRVLRQAADLRQSELAAACGVSRQRVHDVEAGVKPIGARLAGVVAAVIAPRIRADEADVRSLLLPGEDANG